ncbi:hypothetical protein FJZ21_00675 [Candidatus Pacearchaeota archaeon]|nr:hypothetical protein [Candidatus Pacearchaeota archaeon]
MIFKKLKLKNIRSYREEEVVFPEGAVLLAGDVGSGKTSILLAIEYALFGLQPGQRGSSLLSNGEEFGEVSLELEINGNKVLIERGLKRSSKSINQDFAAITINGSRFESSVTEVKLKILELLNYPLDFVRKNNLVYRYTVYTPQEEMKEIIREDIETRLDVLRHVFGIDKYKRIQENTARISSIIRDESRVLQAEAAIIDSRKNDVDSSQKFLNMIQSKVSIKQDEIKEVKNERLLKEKEVEELHIKVSERENFKKEIEKLSLVLRNKQEQKSRFTKDLLEMDDLINSSKSLAINLDPKKINDQIENTLKNIILLEKEHLEFNSNSNSLDIQKQSELVKKTKIFQLQHCPTCLQDVPEAHKHNIMNEVETKINKFDKDKVVLLNQIQKISAELSNQKNILKNLENDRVAIQINNAKQENLNKYITKKQELEKLKDSFEKDITFINDQIDSQKKNALDYSKYDNLLRIKREELIFLINEEKRKEIELAEINKEIEMTIREISKYNSEIQRGQESKNKLIKMLDIEGWLSNNFTNLTKFTEKNILIALRKEFTKIFNKWFSMLTTDSFEVYLDENFSPVIVHNEFELDYEFLSGGERTAVALAYRLALNQLINSVLSKIKTSDVVILDEPTEGFSEAQLDKMRDMLRELNVKQLLIVSHETKMEGFVDHVIRFKKTNGVSEVISQPDLH